MQSGSSSDPIAASCRSARAPVSPRLTPRINAMRSSCRRGNTSSRPRIGELAFVNSDAMHRGRAEQSDARLWVCRGDPRDRELHHVEQRNAHRSLDLLRIVMGGVTGHRKRIRAGTLQIARDTQDLRQRITTGAFDQMSDPGRDSRIALDEQMNVVCIVFGARACRHPAHQLDGGLGPHPADDAHHGMRAHTGCRAG